MGHVKKLALFPMGAVLATQGVMHKLTRAETVALLERHFTGDWGDLDEEDKAANASGLVYGRRLLSSYKVRGIKVWIITEADRSATTVLLPGEY